MKKYLLTAAVFMLAGLGARAFGGATYVTPRGPDQALATADYGGVDYATAAFTNTVSTACSNCSGVFYGINFSSSTASFGQSPDFVDVFDCKVATAAINDNNVIARFYNANGFGGLAITTSTLVSGWQMAPKPIRFDQGLFFRPSNVNLNLTTILFWKSIQR